MYKPKIQRKGLKKIRREATLEEVSHILDKDGNLNGDYKIKYIRRLNSLDVHESLLLRAYYRSGKRVYGAKCNRRMKKAYRDWWLIYLSFPISIRRMLN